ncbi:MAG: FAD-dependent oxidoreductase [bacterium]
MTENHYNVIIVGAGLAGSAAALKCAENNLSVLLIERGAYPGSKNMFGGVIYRKAMEEIIPAFWKKAPLERAIIRDELWLMDTKSIVKIGYENLNYGKPPYNKFTVIRSTFDNWFANQAQKEGAQLKTSTTVVDIIFNKKGLTGRKASGVILEDKTKISGDVVIIAEGLIGDLVHKTGLKKEKSTGSLALYVKELLALPRKKIEHRFNLKKKEGVNIGISGTPTSGAIGKGGIWVNKNTISLVIGAYLNQIIEKGLNPYQLMENFKSHPKMKKILKDTKTIEYQSHLIPKGDPGEMPQVYDHGLMVVGDALTVVGGLGSAYALLTGKLAAETAVAAAAKNQFDRTILVSYKNKLMNLFITKNNLTQIHKKEYFKNYSDADLMMAKAVNKIGDEYSKFTLETNKEKWKKVARELKTVQPLPKTFSDLISGLKNWRLL